MSLLDVTGLSKVFGGIHAVEDLSFTIERGHIHSIIGPNGAGKTTLFNLITGIYKPTTGTIRLDGVDITGQSPSRLAGLGMSRTFQNLQIFPTMTAIENVMVGQHLHLNKRLLPTLFSSPSLLRGDAECREMCEGLMAFVGLERYLKAEASAMPYGALKRLEIARALAAKPKIVLLDEPAAGLNSTESREIDDVIVKVADSGVTVVLVEHDMKMVMGISDHVLVLNYGKSLAEGTPSEIGRHPEVVSAYLGAQVQEAV